MLEDKGMVWASWSENYSTLSIKFMSYVPLLQRKVGERGKVRNDAREEKEGHTAISAWCSIYSISSLVLSSINIINNTINLMNRS